MNRIVIEGNLGRDAETNFTQTGQQVTNLRVATNRYFKRQDGTDGERVEWFQVVSWNHAGAAAALKKGNRVIVVGEMQTRVWEDKQGQKRYNTELVASSIARCLQSQRQNRSQDKPQEPDTSSEKEDFESDTGF